MKSITLTLILLFYGLTSCAPPPEEEPTDKETNSNNKGNFEARTNNQTGEFAECEKLLENGLYEQISTVTRTTLSQDMKSYFLSETFKSDMKDGKWGMNLSIPIDGIPVSIGSSSSDKEFSEFKERLEKSSSFTLNTNDFRLMTQSLANPDLYNAYVECVEIVSNSFRVGLIKGRKIENDNTVIFNFYYRPTSTSEKIPKVKTFTVDPPNALISSGGLKEGKEIPSYLMSVICKRFEDQQTTLNIQFSTGAVTDNSGSIRNSKSDIPVGSIVASYLTFSKFRKSANESGLWRPSSDKWSPCDSRPVPNSKYEREFSETRVPDLRGVFLRGLNNMDPDAPTNLDKLDPAKSDPSNRRAGEFQGDSIKAHSHVEEGNTSSNWAGGGNIGDIAHKRENTRPFGGPETRPKNRAVYYYIRIN